MTSKEAFNVEHNIDILTKALVPFGIAAEKSGRNDMVVNGKKVA
jgi:lipoate-protein ligase A